MSSEPNWLTRISLILLLLVAALLLIPLITGGPKPSPYLVGGMLLARLGLRIWQAQSEPKLKQPVSWAFDVLMIGLIFYVASNQGGG